MRIAGVCLMIMFIGFAIGVNFEEHKVQKQIPHVIINTSNGVEPGNAFTVTKLDLDTTTFEIDTIWLDYK